MKKTVLIKILFILNAFLMILCVIGIDVSAQSLNPKKLIVGTKEAPPFAMKSKDGEWTGISIDLWREIASELKLQFEFREMELGQLLDGVAKGSLDAAVAALTITPEREKLLDFSHPFYTSGLGIAVGSKRGNPWFAVLKRFLSPAFLKIVVTLSFLLMIVGLLIWWFERKRNPQQFEGSPHKGIASGFWWSAVTMTTVGYGDKAPITLGGRIVAIIWMFTAIIVISSFTAAITSSLTVTQLVSPVKGPEDLPKVRVGTIANTTSETYLKEKRISYQVYKTPREGLRAIAEGHSDAMVYDAPILRYLIKQDFRGALEVLPHRFMSQGYGIALPQGNPLREPINRLLLEKIREPFWQDELFRYLG